jgi:Deoxynucleoside kinase
VVKHSQLVRFNPGLFHLPSHLPDKWWSFPPRLLSVDGLRGSGKSTLLAGLLEAYPLLIHYPPPVPRFDEAFATTSGPGWADVDLNCVERWWWDFGQFVLRHGGCGVDAPNETRTFVIEGSLCMSIFLYGQYLQHVGRISKAHFTRLMQMFKRSQRSLVVRAGDTLYLQTDYQIAYDRLKARNDPRDGNISVEFQRACQDRFAQMCMFAGGFQGWDHVVDGNKSAEEVLEEAKKKLGPSFADGRPLAVSEVPVRVRRRRERPTCRPT